MGQTKHPTCAIIGGSSAGQLKLEQRIGFTARLSFLRNLKTQ
jgi:hypothetical protein